MSDKNNFFENVGLMAVGAPIAALIVIMLAVPMSIYNAWAFRIMWAWFIVPTFGLHPLSYGQAIGLSLTVNMLKSSMSIKDEYKEPSLNRFVEALLTPIIALALGWIVKSWLGL